MNLKIAVWNANGLMNHLLELKTFISINEIDIALISETHFTKKNFAKIDGYDIHTTNHPAGTARGGTAIIVRSDIKHVVLNSYRENYIQSTAIQIYDKYGGVNLASVYCPPSCQITEHNFSHYFKSLGNKFIAAGDFNAKHRQWGSRLCTTRGRELLKSINSEHLHHLSTGEPTYWPADLTKTPDLIDFCVLKNINKNYLRISSCLELSSDHSPIILTVQASIEENERQPTLSTNRTNWTKFREFCAQNLNLHIALKDYTDLENSVQHFTTQIQKAAWASTPQQKKSKSKYTKNDIKILINEKRQLRKIWQTTRHPTDKAKFNKATKEVKKILQQQDNLEFENYIVRLSPSDPTTYSLWKATEKFDQTTKRIPPIRKPNGDWAKTDKDKADLFANHLSEVFKPYHSNSDDVQINEYLESAGQMDLPIKPVTDNEITDIIMKQSSKRKSPGYDLITMDLLKELPVKGIRYLRQMINAIFRLCYFPSQLKVAQIILIPKPGKQQELVTSYRPISLLPTLSKIIEKLLLSRLKLIIQDKNLIPDHQFGFRAEHATIEQVHRVVKTIRTAFENKQYCSAAYLDITQAFDKVWHKGLLYKLKMVLPFSYFSLLKSYIEDRYFLIKYNSEQTKLHRIESGVPQGSVLGPVLYTLFTADIPTSEETTIATFADDTVILSSNKNDLLASKHLQNHLNQISLWLETWRMKANANKSNHVTYTLRKGNCPNVFLGTEMLPQSDAAKYLGIHIDRRLTWQKHIFMKRKQMGLKLTSLNWLIGKNSKLSIDNKLLIYKSIIRPIWTYGAEIWGSAAKTNVNIIQRFQSKVLRTICGAPNYVTNNVIQQDLRIPTVEEQINEINRSYSIRLSTHSNNLANNLLQTSSINRRLKRFPLNHLVITR